LWSGAERTGPCWRSSRSPKREFDRLRAADYRARRKTQDRLPKTIAEVQAQNAELVKAAKGIG
jgi:hypothetical protein